MAELIDNRPSVSRATVEKVDGQTLTVFQVIEALNNPKNNLTSKSEDCLFGTLEKEGFGPEMATFRQSAHKFCYTAV
jgi:hypothetical protein